MMLIGVNTLRAYLSALSFIGCALLGGLISFDTQAEKVQRPILSSKISYGQPSCVHGYVWREAFPGDVVCVVPLRREEIRSENEFALRRRNPEGGEYGPDTCSSGFVWREARAIDHVCVSPQSREIVALENARASKLWEPCAEPEQCRRFAQLKQAHVDTLRARLEQRKADLAAAKDAQRRTMERLRREDEEWMRAHPGFGRSTQPSMVDSISPIEQDIREIEKALKDAELESAKAQSRDAAK